MTPSNSYPSAFPAILNKGLTVRFKAMKTNGGNKLYRAGGLTIDPIRRKLFDADGQAVTLTPKTFDLLLVLMESGGRVLTKDELLSTVWSGAFVEEANLAQTISMLRKALGETPEEHRFIVTVPGRGYRFVADVTEFEEETLVGTCFTNPEILPAAKRRTAKTWLAPVLAGVALLLGALVMWGLFRREETPKDALAVKSIAVLPFTNIGGNSNEAYLGPGLAEVLTTRLSNLKNIIVRPSSAVLKYGNASPDPKKIGSELNVEAVIIGRVQEVDGNIRVTVQLVRAADGATLWADKFDDKFTNIFAVQDSVSRQVADALALTLTAGEKKQLAKRETANTEAFQLYLKGLYFWNKRTGPSLQKASGYFEQAIQKDPNYALAYTGLANSYQLLAEYGEAPPQIAFPKAKAAAQKALLLDGQSAEAYTALAYTQAFYEWDWAGAEKSFKRALELNPNYPTAHQWYSEYLTAMGRFDEAHNHNESALEIDPVSPILMANLANIFHIQRQYGKVVEQSDKIIEIDPNFAYAYSYKGFAFELQDRYPEAAENIAKAMTLFGEPPDCAEEVKAAFAKNGLKGFWQKRLEQIETRPHLKNFPTYYKALVQLRLGDKEGTLASLRQAYEERDRLLVSAKMEPFLEPLREDPRFQELLRQLGL